MKAGQPYLSDDNRSSKGWLYKSKGVYGEIRRLQSIRWQGTRGDIGIRKAQSPLDGFRHRRLHTRIIPVLEHMPQARVVDPPFAVALCPCYGKVAVGAMDVLVFKVELRGVEPHEDADFVAGVIFQLIDLVPQHERARP